MTWRRTETYDLAADVVQVLCRVTEYDVGNPPRACNLPVSSGDHGVGDLFVSIGWRGDDGDWFVAGWNMSQDCWQDARCFTVEGWQPLAETPYLLPTELKNTEAFPRRCETGISVEFGECEACGAAEGETCLKPHQKSESN